MDLKKEVVLFHRLKEKASVKKHSRLPIFALLAGMLLCLCFLIACGPSPEREPVQEGFAPDFVLRDLQGNPFRLQDERGKMVLLIFTTTWCPSCRAAIPLYRELYEKYGSRGLVVVNIDIQEPLDRVRQFVENHRIPYRVLLDTTGHVGLTFGVVGVPSLVLVNKDGEIVSDETPVILEILGNLFGGQDQGNS